MNLTPEQVHTLRTAGLLDLHFERLWRISSRALRAARTGKTWRDHPTPPDKKPRKLGRPARTTPTSTPEHP